MSIHINCDIGERGINDADLALLEKVDAVNIAVGGHAGDQETALFYYDAAWKQYKEIAIHPSYPDKANFGRVSIPLTWEDLKASLTEQRKLLPLVHRVKFHGALYHDAMNNEYLARLLADWMVEQDLNEVLTMVHSHLYVMSTSRKIKVITEGFLDRRYKSVNGVYFLTPRPEGLISDAEEMISQTRQLQHDYDCVMNTFCIHSDTPYAIEHIDKIREYFNG